MQEDIFSRRRFCTKGHNYTKTLFHEGFYFEGGVNFAQRVTFAREKNIKK